MFTYMMVYLLRERYNVDAYITENIGKHLAQYFQVLCVLFKNDICCLKTQTCHQGLGELPVAERQLCGVAAFLKKHQREQRAEIKRLYVEER